MPVVVTVFELTAYLKEIIDTDPLLSDLWVRGEVTSFFQSAAGHCYFTLSNEDVQLRCVLFRGQRRGLPFLPKQGDAIVAHGHVSIYEANGEYQLYVDTVAPEGSGIIQLQFEEVRRRLETEGLFAVERKRPIPRFPKVIGLVTSAQGAVFHDVHSIIRRRYPVVELLLAPSAVQGTDAPDALIAGLNALQVEGTSDVIVICRGGGSPEDLACFNSESLARAIFASNIPIVSAIGHETDVTIADLVADLRAPTPSAAAEMIVPDQQELRAMIQRELTNARDDVSRFVGNSRDQLSVSALRLAHKHPVARIERSNLDVDVRTQSLRRHMDRTVANYERGLATRKERIELLNPREVLRRGYVVVSSSNGGEQTRVSRAKNARDANLLMLDFFDGSVEVAVSANQR